MIGIRYTRDNSERALRWLAGAQALDTWYKSLPAVADRCGRPVQFLFLGPRSGEYTLLTNGDGEYVLDKSTYDVNGLRESIDLAALTPEAAMAILRIRDSGNGFGLAKIVDKIVDWFRLYDVDDGWRAWRKEV